MACESGKLVDEVTNGVSGGLNDKWVERDSFESSSHHFGDGRHSGRDDKHDALGESVGGDGKTTLTTAGAAGASRDCGLAAAAAAGAAASRDCELAAAAGAAWASRAVNFSGASRAAVTGVLAAAYGGAKVDTADAGLTSALGSVGGAAADVAALVVDRGAFDSKISCV